MADEGTSFTIDLPVTGVEKIDAATASLDMLAERLDAATKAVQAQEQAYRTAETTADKAAKALERIGQAAEAQRDKMKAAMAVGDDKTFWKAAGALNSLQAQQVVAAEKAAKAKAALDAEAASLDKLKAQAGKLDEALKKRKGEGEGLNFEALRRGLSKFGGPLAVIGEQIADVGSGVGKLGKALGSSAGPWVAAAVALAAVAAAMLAIAAAAAVAAVKVAAFAVELANTSRTNELLAQGMLKFSKTGGAELNDKINFLTKQLPLTREEIASTAEQLANAGLRGKALSDTLQMMTIRAARMKFGPDWQKQMLSLDEQSKVFSYNLSRLFGGLKIDGLLTGLQTLGALFDEDTASGKAIKVVFESLFQPLVDGATGAVPKIERFFIQLEILALKALIALKPHASLIMMIGEALAVVALIVVGALVGAFAVLAIMLAIPLALTTALVMGFMWLYDETVKLGSAIGDWFSSFSLVDVGKSMIDGLANGIAGAGSKVFEALKGAAMGAVDGVKNLLGIHSPSRVLELEVGDPMGAGVERGVERRTAGVRGALEAMTAAPDVDGGSAPGAGGAGGARGAFDFSGAQFIFHGVKDADDAEQRFEGVLTRILEGDAAQLGAVAPVTT